ncbi:hypothetical protein SAY86_006607 [Trapa natans]|uniref:Small ribosomal subunit protein bS20c n=1 Tax=Trapa natans TaxID=22666 RepID=A0AAN7L6X6_TRANT|nr:hypothetical protein SAY86_006607 [Trapa natans]
MASLSSCFALPSQFRSLSLSSHSHPSSVTGLAAFKPLGFSTSISHTVFSRGYVSVQNKPPPRLSVVCDAATNRKADSAAKRARQAEKRRVFNKSRKSEIKTRMKKVLEALDGLKKNPEAQAEEIIPVEKLIAEAYSVIDKAVKVGTLHRNTGARRKSRLARRKKAVEIHLGWYVPTAAASASA